MSQAAPSIYWFFTNKPYVDRAIKNYKRRCKQKGCIFLEPNNNVLKPYNNSCVFEIEGLFYVYLLSSYGTIAVYRIFGYPSDTFRLKWLDPEHWPMDVLANHAS